MKATRRKPTGGKTLIRHIKQGAEFFTKTGEWFERRRDINFESDRYVEDIVSKDGTVVRHVDEPLSQHQGRGSAKKKKKT
jgi:hypothetical protein